MKNKYSILVVAAADLLVIFVLSIICPLAHAGTSGLVVHEWGTFTSFQGGDGALLFWQPLQTSRLPDFVYNWSRPGFDRASAHLPGVGGKYSLMARQRLETPVVYFYSDHEQTVDLTVDFPQGWITEWFPRADMVSHSADESLIRWSNLRLFPSAHGSDLVTHRPTSTDHYFTARETDADYVKTKDETEKFLFYRGAGDFSTPLRVTMKLDAAVVLTNTGKETISHLFALEVDEKAANFVSVPELKPGEERTVFVAPGTQKISYEPGDPFAEDVGRSVARALVQSGLYPREANAMVNTWKDSWFKERGVRVFYVLPRPWTDRTLPATFHPTPAELVRVMVGRAEVLTPGVEQTLVTELNQAKQGDAAASAQARQTLRNLGRFAAPAFYRALAAAKPQPTEQKRLLSLLNDASAFE